MYDVPVSVETRCAGEEKAYARGVNLHVVDAACSVARLEVAAGNEAASGEVLTETVAAKEASRGITAKENF